MKYALWLWVFILIWTGPARASWIAVPPEVRAALVHCEQAELFTIDPNVESVGKARFHGYRFVDHCTLTTAEGTRLGPGILKRIKGSEEPSHSTCFQPRHALRVGDVEILICYQCGRVHCFSPRLDWWGAFDGKTAPRDPRTARGIPPDNECQAMVKKRGLQAAGWAEGPPGTWTSDRGVRVNLTELAALGFKPTAEDDDLSTVKVLMLERSARPFPTTLTIVDGAQSQSWKLPYVSGDEALASMNGLPGVKNGEVKAGPRGDTVRVKGSLVILAGNVDLLQDKMETYDASLDFGSVGDEKEARAFCQRLAANQRALGEWTEVRRGRAVLRSRSASGKGPARSELTLGYLRSGDRCLGVSIDLPGHASEQMKRAVQDCIDRVEFPTASPSLK